MNMESLVTLIIVLVLLVWGGGALRRLSKRIAEESELHQQRGMIKTSGTILWGCAALLTIFTVTRYIDTDFGVLSGPQADLPASSMPPSEPVKPDVSVIDGRPDMTEVRDEHREQLEEFEDDTPPTDEPESDE